MSLKTIANNLGLSVAAVSRALNGHRDISDATRQRIQEERLSPQYARTPPENGQEQRRRAGLSLRLFTE